MAGKALATFFPLEKMENEDKQGNKMESCNSEQNSKKNLTYILAAIFSKKKDVFFQFFLQKNGSRIKKKQRGDGRGNVYTPSSFSLLYTKMSNPQ